MNYRVHQSNFFFGAYIALMAISTTQIFALTLEGKSMTLTLSDSAIVYDDVLRGGKDSDHYGWNWKTPEIRNQFTISIFELEGKPVQKEQLKELAEALLVTTKEEYAETGFKKNFTSLQPVLFNSGGWSGYSFYILSSTEPNSKYIEASLVLWGGGRAWRSSYSGMKDQLKVAIQVLEKAVWKTDSAISGQVVSTNLEFPPQENRVWTNAAGKTFEGKLISINNSRNILRIQRSDGQMFDGIPVNFLSAKDRQHIESLIQELEKKSENTKK